MMYRERLNRWSIPLGTWFATDVYMTYLMPLLALVLCIKFGPLIGGVLSVLLIISTLLHEFGHILGARSTGGEGYEILLWPCGGLAAVQPAPTFSSRIMTTAAGPIVNLALCVITFPAVYHASGSSQPHVEVSASILVEKPTLLQQAFNPLVLPQVDLTNGHIISGLLVLLFAVNYLLLLVNLIPVYPLDGGKILQTVLTQKMGRQYGVQVYVKVGFFIGIALMVIGMLLTDDATGRWVVMIGAIITILNLQESMQLQSEETPTDSFMEYDFSEGYTSLARTDIKVERRPGFIQRWREARKIKREQQERERVALEEKQVDALLNKVHENGYRFSYCHRAKNSRPCQQPHPQSRKIAVRLSSSPGWRCHRNVTSPFAFQRNFGIA